MDKRKRRQRMTPPHTPFCPGTFYSAVHVRRPSADPLGWGIFASRSLPKGTILEDPSATFVEALDHTTKAQEPLTVIRVRRWEWCGATTHEHNTLSVTHHSHDDNNIFPTTKTSGGYFRLRDDATRICAFTFFMNHTDSTTIPQGNVVWKHHREQVHGFCVIIVQRFTTFHNVFQQNQTTTHSLQWLITKRIQKGEELLVAYDKNRCSHTHKPEETTTTTKRRTTTTSKPLKAVWAPLATQLLKKGTTVRTKRIRFKGHTDKVYTAQLTKRLKPDDDIAHIRFDVDDSLFELPRRHIATFQDT